MPKVGTNVECGTVTDWVATTNGIQPPELDTAELRDDCHHIFAMVESRGTSLV